MADYLITGGAGFIGSNLAHHLVSSGASVRILDNFSTGRRENLADIIEDIEVVAGDLRDPDDVRNAVQGCRYILHTGALPSVPRSIEDPRSSNEVNITGTLSLLDEAHHAGVERVVFSSSSSVYGDTPVLPKHEDMIPAPKSPYALSKLTGEHYCRIFYELHGLITFSLRYFNVFGPRQSPDSQYAAVIPKFIDALSRDESPVIYGAGDQTRDFTYVDDIVAANLCCCTAPVESAGVAYNVAWGNRISINDLAGHLKMIMNKDIDPVYKDKRVGDVLDSQADSDRARTGLGWEPKVSFEEGLQRTVAWMAGEK